MVKLLATVPLLLLACSGPPSGADSPVPSSDDRPSEGLPSEPAPEPTAGNPPTMPVVSVSGAGGASAQGGEQTAPQGQAGGGTGGSSAGAEAVSGGAGVAGTGGEAGAPVQPPALPEGATLVDGAPMAWSIAPYTCWRFTAEDPNAEFFMQVGKDRTPIGCVPTGLGMVMNPSSQSYAATGTARFGSWIKVESQPYASCSLSCAPKAAP